ncbi:MAG: AAA family ATPase [Albidovulum sp.]|nr:AAA family ATPase [Albidovulum sp.]
MKIESVRIENFRSFKDETISFNDYSCLVGANGAGKSTVLTALNVFFRESEDSPTNLRELGIEDFHRKNVRSPVRITVTFTDLSDEAKDDFANYVRQDRLVVSAQAEFDPDIGKARVLQFGYRLGMRAFAGFFEASEAGKLVSELKEIYAQLHAQFPKELRSTGTKQQMIDALHEYEAKHPEDCALIQSQDRFYGFSEGRDRLAKHIQWIYVPAVKDPTSEQVEAKNSALGQLLARTVRAKTNFAKDIASLRTNTQKEYEELLRKNQGVLTEISDELQGQISDWAHPDARVSLHWKQDLDRSVRVEEPLAHLLAGEGKFEGELGRFGHGLQRSYLLALLQVLATTDDSTNPTLLLACEEPELYQHPPQARHLAGVLSSLSGGNAQVIVSTHNPLFVSGKGFESVRMVRKDPTTSASSVSFMSIAEMNNAISRATGTDPVKLKQVIAKIHQALQPSLNEMFFTNRLVLVEGNEDIAYITTYMNLLNKDEEYRRIGCHIVASNGKNALVRPVAIAKHLGIPTYLVFDSDAGSPDTDKQRRENKALLTLAGCASEDPLPSQDVWGNGFTMWHSDIGSVVKDEIGAEAWEEARKKVDRQFGQTRSLRKNPLRIGESLAHAWLAGKRSKSLEKLCTAILDANNHI